MKTLILTTTVALFAATGLQAQDRGNHDNKHRGDRLTHLAERLDLTESQAEEVAAIFEDSRAQHKEVQASVKDEHCAIRENTIAELSEVLDEEQMAELESLREKRGGRRFNHGMPRFANCEI